MSGLKYVWQNQEEENNQTVNKDDESPSGDRKQKGCMTRVLENLSTYRPRWWIGRSSFCPRQDENYPAALLLCLHGDVKIKKGTFEKGIQFNQKTQSFSKTLSQHRYLENKKKSWIYIYEFSHFISTVQTVSHKYHFISLSLFPVGKTWAKCAF